MTITLGMLGACGRRGEALIDRAVETERAGYGTLWIIDSPPAELHDVERVLDATTSLTVATGVVNIWSADAATVAASCHRLERNHHNRFLLGVGVGHSESDPRHGGSHDALVAYLDALREHLVPKERVVLAALGPRSLTLARERTAGATGYLVTPEHTLRAREVLGEGPLLMSTQLVTRETDAARARAVGRAALVRPYLGLRDYTNNLRRLGYGDDDLADEGSDRLIDDLLAYGDNQMIARRITAHLKAGADHVVVQALDEDPLPTYRAIADTMLRGS